MEAPYRISDAEGAEDALPRRFVPPGISEEAPIQNMTDLLEEHGIKVFKLDLPERVDGLSCRVHRLDGGRRSSCRLFHREIC